MWYKYDRLKHPNMYIFPCFISGIIRCSFAEEAIMDSLLHVYIFPDLDVPPNQPSSHILKVKYFLSREFKEFEPKFDFLT